MEHGGKLHKENKLNYKKFQCTFKKFYEINVLGLVAWYICYEIYATG